MGKKIGQASFPKGINNSSKLSKILSILLNDMLNIYINRPYSKIYRNILTDSSCRNFIFKKFLAINNAVI